MVILLALMLVALGFAFTLVGVLGFAQTGALLIIIGIAAFAYEVLL